MHCNEAEMEALEWGGLLHDVGKIGVPDHVLLKAGPPHKDERTIMNSHPVLGAQIISPVTKLAPSCRSSATTTSGTTALAIRTG